MNESGVKGRRRVVFELRTEPNSDVFIAGSFNGWDATARRMTESREAGLYRAILMLPRGRHEYKFVINGVWCVDPECPDWVPNDQGSLNSVITVE